MPPSTHPFADGDGLLGQALGVGDVVLHDGLEELILILTVEGRLEGHQVDNVSSVSGYIMDGNQMERRTRRRRVYTGLGNKGIKKTKQEEGEVQEEEIA